MPTYDGTPVLVHVRPFTLLTGSVALFAAGVLSGFILLDKPLAPAAEPQFLEPMAGVSGEATAFGGTVETSSGSEPGEPSESASTGAAKGPAAPRPWADLAERTLSFAVSVRAGASYGAGALVADGTILTARHVIAGEDAVEVRFSDGEWMGATRAAEDMATDLAVLSTASSGHIARSEHTAASIGSARALRPGVELLSVGSPRELGFTVQRGIVAHTGRRFGRVDYVQTDLPANPGSSGGPVVNDQGELVGVMAFILRDSQGIAFVTPIEEALPLLSRAGVAGFTVSE